jgi:hypothetical protein
MVPAENAADFQSGKPLLYGIFKRKHKDAPQNRAFLCLL